MHAAIMEQRRLRDGAFHEGSAEAATARRLVGIFLNGLEAMSFPTFVFVERHGQLLSQCSLRLNAKCCRKKFFLV